MTAQRNRYHKHIFAGSERIATKVGGGIPHAYLPPNDQNTLSPQMPPEIPPATQSTTAPLAATDSTWDSFLHQTASCLGVQRQNLTLDFTLVSLQEKVPTPETQAYFYHTDHLGSTGFLSATLSTTGGARLVQHYQYMPFGELFVHQNTQQYHNPYDFSARERDIETGFQYFGARHYHSEWGIWLSVDPLADLAPHLTPYRYAFNNSIRYHDPSGLFEVARDGGGEPPSLPEVDGIAVSTMGVVIYTDRIHKYNFSSTLVGKVIANVPVLGGISQAVEGALNGDWKNAAIGLGSASLDVVLFTTTAGTGNILRIIFKETAANTVSQQLTDNLQDFGIPTAIILPIAIVAGSKLNPSKKLGVADDVGDATKGGVSAYEAALAGGTHSGWLNTMSKLPTSKLQKSITSMEANIIKHQNLISNPAKYLQQYGKGNWNALHPNQQQHLLNVKWPGDIQRAQEQINILQGIIKTR